MNRPKKYRLRIGDKIVGYEEWCPLEEGGIWLYSEDNSDRFPWHDKYIRHTDKDQFTGLCDKNKQEAYFEDLYKISGNDKVYHISSDFDYRQMVDVETHFKYCRAEIIGNVFQNKDLMEKKT